VLQLARHERLNDMQVTVSHTRVPVAASAHLGTLPPITGRWPTTPSPSSSGCAAGV
jgi:hypothetical protein